jgi:hypothetical protein
MTQMVELELRQLVEAFRVELRLQPLQIHLLELVFHLLVGTQPQQAWVELHIQRTHQTQCRFQRPQ